MSPAAVNLQTRLEARWRELQAAWAYLGEARAERRIAIDRWRAKIRATQETLDALLRESHPQDPVEHLRECHAAFGALEAAKRALESTRKRHDATVSEREQAFEAALLTDQLPLFGNAEISAVGRTVVDDQLVKVGERLFVRGRGRATVMGFRQVEDVEVVVMRVDGGEPFEAVPATLCRDEPDDEISTRKRRGKAPHIGDEVATAQGEVGVLVRTQDREGETWGAVVFEGGGSSWHDVASLEVVRRAKRRAEISA